MTMFAKQLEDLLGKVTRWWEIGAFGSTGHVVIDNNQNPICVCLNDDEDDTHATLIALSPSLARRVVAAEKLAEALDNALSQDDDHWALCRAALAAYHEAIKRPSEGKRHAPDAR